LCVGLDQSSEVHVTTSPNMIKKAPCGNFGGNALKHQCHRQPFQWRHTCVVSNTI